VVLQDEATVGLADLVRGRTVPPVLQLQQTVGVRTPQLQLLLDLIGHERRLLVGLHDHVVLAVLAILASRLISLVLLVLLVTQLDQLIVG